MSSSSYTMQLSPVRVIIGAELKGFPGPPDERVIRLGYDFCEDVFHRRFSNYPHAGYYDMMHFLPDYDSETAAYGWFIYDCNINGPLDQDSLEEITHLVYNCRRDEHHWAWTVKGGAWAAGAKQHALRAIHGVGITGTMLRLQSDQIACE